MHADKTPTPVRDERFLQGLQQTILRNPIMMFGAKAFDKPTIPTISLKTPVPFARKIPI